MKCNQSHFLAFLSMKVLNPAKSVLTTYVKVHLESPIIIIITSSSLFFPTKYFVFSKLFQVGSRWRLQAFRLYAYNFSVCIISNHALIIFIYIQWNPAIQPLFCGPSKSPLVFLHENPVITTNDHLLESPVIIFFIKALH